MSIPDLKQAVIALQYIAHQVEQELGKGKLSVDIRKCADRLDELVSPISKNKVNTAKGDQ